MCNKIKAILMLLIILSSAGIAQASILDNFRDAIRNLAMPANVYYPSTDSVCTESQLSGLRSWVDTNIPITSTLQVGKDIIHLNAGKLGFPCTTARDIGYYEIYMQSYWEYKYNQYHVQVTATATTNPTTWPTTLPTISQPNDAPPPEIIPEPIATVIGVQQSPGFESGLALLGMLITALLVLRRDKR